MNRFWEDGGDYVRQDSEIYALKHDRKNISPQDVENSPKVTQFKTHISMRCWLSPTVTYVAPGTFQYMKEGNCIVPYYAQSMNGTQRKKKRKKKRFSNDLLQKNSYRSTPDHSLPGLRRLCENYHSLSDDIYPHMLNPQAGIHNLSIMEMQQCHPLATPKPNADERKRKP